MVPGAAPGTESFPRVGYAPTQHPRPSVTWALSSPSAQAAAARATPRSGVYPGSASRRDGPGNRPETNVRAQPQICFLQPRTSRPLVPFSLMNSSEAAKTKFLPKSHLSRVIIRDNLSAQRLYEIELKASDKTKKKMAHLYDHLKKKFMMDQLRKLGRWKRESMNIQRYLDSIRVHKASFRSNKKSRGQVPAPGP